MALVRSDPFRDFDRFVQQAFGGSVGERAWSMPMDAYRKDDTFLLQLDVPGISPDSVELTVDNNVLTVKATRHAPVMHDGVSPLISERPFGDFTREILLGNNLDLGQIRAEYDAGVLTVSIPVAEHAKPRRIDVSVREGAAPIPSGSQAQAVAG
ncbi:MAG: Hsp20/alpha crystallin family protein [Actinomycetota bacterium]|nr:Hsp20/alpha crystallin family protein [Actinomycetota bacterium]MDH5278142.1 Hsp20/alpha crystallin family protein [Actinomycetota bacterium]